MGNGGDENGKATEHPYALLRRIARAARGLKPFEHHVLVHLSLYMSTRDFTARPSQKTLAADMHMSVKTVGRALRKLREVGFIEEVNPGRGSRMQNGVRVGIVTTYRVTVLTAAEYSDTVVALPTEVTGQIRTGNQTNQGGIIGQIGTDNATTVADKGTKGTEGTEGRAGAREAVSSFDPLSSELVDFYTRVLNSGEPVAPSILRPNAARQLVAMGKVSRERLRELGVTH